LSDENKFTMETMESYQPAQRLKYKVLARPDFSVLRIELPVGKTLKVESAAMVAMDEHIELETTLRGGIGRFLTSEGLFINQYRSEQRPGELWLAPGPLGEIKHFFLQNQTVYLQASCFLASDVEIVMETKWQGVVKGFFSGHSMFLTRCSGLGDLWFHSYGAIIEIEVEDEYLVDTGHIVGFTEGLDYTVTKLGGYKSLFFSGEGLVCHFRGKGKIWIQSRQIPALADWVEPYRPVRKRKSD
jgi:uncharacterized protein (TIGR00266 family)